MRLAVEEQIDRPPEDVFDFVARQHWRNHPRWDSDIVEITPLTPSPIGVGSRALVRRKRGGDGVLEVIAFEPDSRWVSRSQIGPFSLEMTALVEPAAAGTSRLTLVGDTTARSAVRLLLPVLAVVFRRQMRASLRRIKDMVESESSAI